MKRTGKGASPWPSGEDRLLTVESFFAWVDGPQCIFRKLLAELQHRPAYCPPLAMTVTLPGSTCEALNSLSLPPYLPLATSPHRPLQPSCTWQDPLTSCSGRTPACPSGLHSAAVPSADQPVCGRSSGMLTTQACNIL